ncbi:hypothetical protein BOS5A_30084 [Bosea sp. EC-HK365B]|nr:hypothetical protein BOSE21B_90047 [Bosea sp. 21B]VVT62223.1 hypothetical protein BOS5A_30084 [Bosea sp. EC-HK365B]VXB45298.1 hypothetical protein BOSE127_120082 [Bosea sp. 127]
MAGQSRNARRIANGNAAIEPSHTVLVTMNPLITKNNSTPTHSGGRSAPGNC